MSITQHTQVPLPEDVIFKISPSSIAKFFEFPKIWFEEQVLGNKQFHGNTSTILGSYMHYIAEQFALSQINGTTLDPESIAQAIEDDLELIDNPDVSHSEVLSLYRDMGTALINEYLRFNIPTEVEKSVAAEVQDGIYVAGTIDNLTGSCTLDSPGIVVDYKSAKTKPNTDKIPFNYKIQLLAYAYALEQAGKYVDRIRIVYVVRPTKTLPIRVYEVTEQITSDDWILISDTLKLIAETIQLHYDKPEYTHLLFKSMSLKNS